MATASNTSLIPTSPPEDTQTSGTDLEEINTDDERNIDTSKWSDKERKKLQHMKEFHEVYQRVFSNKASLRTIIRKRIAHMYPPIPHSICEEEMQDTNIDTKEFIIEHIPDAHGKKVKKIKPLFIKSKPNKTCVQHIPSDEELPVVPEVNFTQKQEITIDSYSESISSDDEASDDRTITADSDSSEVQDFEDTSCKLETSATEIEATLIQIASGLQSAADGYLALASHLPKLSPYELPQIVAQIPPPPMDLPMPIQKALATEGENKTIHYLLHGEYKLNNTSWSRLKQKYTLNSTYNKVAFNKKLPITKYTPFTYKYITLNKKLPITKQNLQIFFFVISGVECNVSQNTMYTALKGNGRPGSSQYQQKRKRSSKQETIASTPGQTCNT